MTINNKLKSGDARSLLLLLEGECVSASKLSDKLTDSLLNECLIRPITHGSRISYRVLNASDLRLWLHQQYHIEDLPAWIQSYDLKETLSRSKQVQLSGDSKSRFIRSFKGFLVNVCEPLEVEMNGHRFMLVPQPGMAHFIEDFEHFKVPDDVTVIGVENGENFQHLNAQRYLFDAPKVLFVSRYPQSLDLRNWLCSIPNPYIHFGDFDLAGIHIYLSEFYAHLGNRAEFFIPNDIEDRLAHGNRKLYNQQLNKYKDREITDRRLLPLVQLIHHYGCGYEQEGYLK